MNDYDDLSYWLIEAEKQVEEDLNNGIVELMTDKKIPLQDIFDISISQDLSSKNVVMINTKYGKSYIFKKFDTMNHAILFKSELENIIVNGYIGKLTFMDVCKKVRNRSR